MIGLVGSLLLLCVSGSVLVVEQTPSTGEAKLRLLSSVTGETLATSSVTFHYPAPLVETTVDPTTGEFYLVTYPTEAKGAVLFELDSSLNLKQKLEPSEQFFDLQYSTGMETLYGIFVSSRYGRILSNFTFTSQSSSVQKHYTLPYMWYVNASSFDQSTSTYFALLNNFPGFPNSTSDQLLAVANFGASSGFSIFPLAIDGLSSTGNKIIFKFFAWSAEQSQLYGLAFGKTKALLAAIDTTSGSAELLTTYPDVQDIGPSFVTETNFCAFITSSVDMKKSLVCWDLETVVAKVVKTYDEVDLIFGAATYYADGQ